MSETARLAHYVLPAPTQYEKWEATFFNFEFPRNVFHLRRPLLAPPDGPLPEPEIHARLVEALGAVTDDDLDPLREAAKAGRAAFGAAFLAAMSAKPQLARVAPVVLYRTLGPTLPDGAAAAAALWAAAHRAAQAYPESIGRAGHTGEGPMAAEALFDAILTGRSGVVLTDDGWDEVLRRVKTPDGRIHLLMPELMTEFQTLGESGPVADPEWPFILTAGERRSFTANTIMRDPSWRKRDSSGALRISPADAERLGVADGGLVRVSTRRGSATATVDIDERMSVGHVSLPNGLGLDHTGEDGRPVITGVAPNELTSAGDRDPWAGTPWHKHVPARVEAVA